MNSRIKFIHLSDIHIGIETHGRLNPVTGRNTRLEDVLHSLEFVFETAIRESVDLVLIAGDVFHRENPHPTEETEFAKLVSKLVSLGGVKVVITLGNHDYPSSFGKAAAVDIFPAFNLDGVLIAKKPDVYPIITKRGMVQVACLPWARLSTLLTKDEYKSLSSEELQIEIEKRLILVVRDLIKRIEGSHPAIFLGHLALREAARSGTEMTTLLTQDPAIPKSELANAVFAYAALGHVHKFQDLNDGSKPPVVYSGSIERIDFTEEREKKGFVMGQIFKDESGWGCHFEFIETPARRFLTIEAGDRDTNQSESIVNLIKRENTQDAVVRIRLKVSKPEDQFDEKEIREALSDAYSVKLEKIFEKQEKVLRQTELSKSMDIEEALDKYISSKPELKNMADDMKKYAGELIKKSKEG